MGSFLGHFVPGALFCLFALWLAVNAFIRFCRHRYKNTPFISSTSYPCPFSCCGKCKDWPFDGLLKIIGTTAGALGELITGFQDPTFPMGNKQHMLMYVFFGVTGVIDILSYHNFPLPIGTDFAGFIIAVSIELILFRFHLHGREELDVHLHMLLVYTLCITVLALLLQMRHQHQPLAALFTSFLFCVQGTWFIQVGCILYNPLPGAIPWKQDDPEAVMLATIYFAWHVGIAFIFYILLSVFVGVIYRRYEQGSSDFYGDRTKERLVRKDDNGHSRSGLNESDSDIEYSRPLMQN